MKKIIALLLLCSLLFCAACSRSDSADPSDEDLAKTTIEKSNENYKANLRLSKSMDWAGKKALISDQNVTKGLICCDNKDLSDVGCGVIAVYNISIMQGEPRDLIDLIYWFEQNGGFVMNGVFGVNPRAIAEFYDMLGKKADEMTDADDLEDSRKKSGYYIICQWNSQNNPVKGAHYYAVEDKNGYLTVYNGMVPGSDSYKDFDSLLSKGGNLIRAYRID